MKRYAIADNVKKMEKSKRFYKSLDEAISKSDGKKVFEIQLHPEVYDRALGFLHMIVTNKPNSRDKERIFTDYNSARAAYNRLGATIHDADIRTVWRINEIKREKIYSMR